VSKHSPFDVLILYWRQGREEEVLGELSYLNDLVCIGIHLP
jgi:hypothetical protein